MPATPSRDELLKARVEVERGIKELGYEDLRFETFGGAGSGEASPKAALIERLTAILEGINRSLAEMDGRGAN